MIIHLQQFLDNRLQISSCDRNIDLFVFVFVDKTNVSLYSCIADYNAQVSAVAAVHKSFIGG
jgi:hypothetical protein